MTKDRDGFHSLNLQIPNVLWDALEQEASQHDVSITNVLTEILRKRYRVSADELPKRKKAGRKPKKSNPK